jgi:hypothetical protein
MPPVARALTLNDGQVHTIDGPVAEDIVVSDGPNGAATTLVVVEGAAISGEVSAFGGSIVEMNGGELLGYLFAYDQTSVRLEGGTGLVAARDDSNVDVSGGSHLVDVKGGGNASISGGQVEFTYLGTGSADVSGGLFTYFYFTGKDVRITGGQFSILDVSQSETTVIEADEIRTLQLNSNTDAQLRGGSGLEELVLTGSLEILGTDFELRVDPGNFGQEEIPTYTLDLPPGEYTDLPPISYLSGTLADGSNVSAAWFVAAAGSSLRVVPEPSSHLLAALGVCVVAVLRRLTSGPSASHHSRPAS